MIDWEQSNRGQESSDQNFLFWSSLLNHGTALPYCQSLGVEHPTVWKKTNKSERNQRIKRQTTNLVYNKFICWNGVREYFTKIMLHLL